MAGKRKQLEDLMNMFDDREKQLAFLKEENQNLVKHNQQITQDFRILQESSENKLKELELQLNSATKTISNLEKKSQTLKCDINCCEHYLALKNNELYVHNTREYQDIASKLSNSEQVIAHLRATLADLLRPEKAIEAPQNILTPMQDGDLQPELNTTLTVDRPLVETSVNVNSMDLPNLSHEPVIADEPKIIIKFEDLNQSDTEPIVGAEDHLHQAIEVECNSCHLNFDISNNIRNEMPDKCTKCINIAPLKTYRKNNALSKSKRKKYNKCHVCNKVFKYPCKLKSHLMTHTGEKPFSCEVCGKSFAQKFSLKHHQQIHLKNSLTQQYVTLECSICYITFNSVKTLQEGSTSLNALAKCSRCWKENSKKFKNVSRERNFYKCHVCNKSYLFPSKLKNHMLSHTAERQFQCGICGKAFRHSFNLKVHSRNHIGENIHKDMIQMKCEIFQSSFSLNKNNLDSMKPLPVKFNNCNDKLQCSTDANTQESEITYRNMHKCNVCNKVFSFPSKLKSHLLSHTGEKPFGCELCGKSFAHAYNLKIHTFTHRMKEQRKHVQLECVDCHKSFRFAKDPRISRKERMVTFKCSGCKKKVLKVSRNTTSKRNDYKCSICSKVFIFPSKLKVHLLSHMGEKPYNCNICSKSFSQAFNLKTHYRTHLRKKPFLCNICGKSFCRLKTIVSHSKMHEGQKDYSCTICGEHLDVQSNINKHVCLFNVGNMQKSVENDTESVQQMTEVMENAFNSWSNYVPQLSSASHHSDLVTSVEIVPVEILSQYPFTNDRNPPRQHLLNNLITPTIRNQNGYSQCTSTAENHISGNYRGSTIVSSKSATHLFQSNLGPAHSDKAKLNSQENQTEVFPQLYSSSRFLQKNYPNGYPRSNTGAYSSQEPDFCDLSELAQFCSPTIVTPVNSHKEENYKFHCKYKN